MNAPRRRPPPKKNQKRKSTSKRKPQQPTQLSRWVPAIAAVAVLGVVVVAGGFGSDDGGQALDFDGASIDNDGYVVTDLTAPSGAAAGIATDPGATIVKTTLTSSLQYGSSGDEVKTLQARLTALGFAPGAADGLFGDQTRQAVWAFEKLVLQTPRAKATGTVTNEVWQRMQDPLVVAPLRPGNGTHVEIYLPQQVAAVFTDNHATLVMHVSSGDGKEFCETVQLDVDAQGNKLDPPVDKAVCGISKTPGGVFKFDRQVQGKRVGPLGGMMNPVYFNYGIAMHGADNVPLTPASHGCIRMHQRISDVFQSFVSIGDRVYVWGEDGKQPEAYTRAESLPSFNYPDPNATTTTSTTTTTTTTTTTVAASTTTTVPVTVPVTVPPVTVPPVTTSTTTTTLAATTTAAPG